MAPQAWQLMGPITNEEIWFYPILIKNFEEIRSGIISKARKNSERSSRLSGMNSLDLFSLVKRKMLPEHLFSLLEDISTPWIILPRVYDHLEEHHSQYLMGYLKYLDEETNSEFGRILARITIEFVGNYTLHFFSETLPKKRMIEALFYGYAAMFWKNLRNPPNGLEDIGIFENFFRWAKIFRNSFASINCEMERTFESMEEEKEKAFPAFNAFGLACDSHNDVSRFFITLRHGYPGIEAVIKYFGIGGHLIKNTTDGRLPYATVPKALSVLFREIKRRYSTETVRTQESIREVLMKLSAEYDQKRIRSVSTGGRLPDQLRFVGPRVLDMIHDLAESIH